MANEDESSSDLKGVLSRILISIVIFEGEWSFLEV